MARRLAVRRFARWSPQHQARYLKSVGVTPERFRKFKPKMQRSALKKAGIERRREASPTYFLEPRTLAQAKKEARQLSELEYGPRLKEKVGEERAAKFFAEKQLPSFFERYQADLGEAQRRTAEAQSKAQTEAEASAQASTASYQKEQEKRKAEAEQFAQKTGAAPERPSEASQAELTRSRSSEAFKALLGSRAATDVGYYGGLKAAGTKAGIEAQTTERRRQRAIAKEKEQLKGERGLRQIELIGKAREGERQWAGEQAAFRIDLAELREKRRAEKARERLTRRGQNITKRGQDISSQDRRAALEVTKRGQDVTSEGQRRSFVKDLGVSPEKWDSWSRGQQARYLKRNKLIGKTKAQGKQQLSDADYYTNRFENYRNKGYYTEEQARRKAKRDVAERRRGRRKFK